MAGESDSLDLTCPICTLFLIEPVTLPCCKKDLCKQCLDQALAESALTCPFCRIRIAVWVRKMTRAKTLVNEEKWNELQRLYPDDIRRRLEGLDEPETESSAPRIVLARPGEIHLEYEEEKKKYERELEEIRQAEEEASRLLIAQLQEEGEAMPTETQKAVEERMKMDEDLASMLLAKETENAEALPVDRAASPLHASQGRMGPLDSLFAAMKQSSTESEERNGFGVDTFSSERLAPSSQAVQWHREPSPAASLGRKANKDTSSGGTSIRPPATVTASSTVTHNTSISNDSSDDDSDADCTLLAEVSPPASPVAPRDGGSKDHFDLDPPETTAPSTPDRPSAFRITSRAAISSMPSVPSSAVCRPSSGTTASHRNFLGAVPTTSARTAVGGTCPTESMVSPSCRMPPVPSTSFLSSKSIGHHDRDRAQGKMPVETAVSNPVSSGGASHAPERNPLSQATSTLSSGRESDQGQCVHTLPDWRRTMSAKTTPRVPAAPAAAEDGKPGSSHASCPPGERTTLGKASASAMDAENSAASVSAVEKVVTTTTTTSVNDESAAPPPSTVMEMEGGTSSSSSPLATFPRLVFRYRTVSCGFEAGSRQSEDSVDLTEDDSLDADLELRKTSAKSSDSLKSRTGAVIGVPLVGTEAADSRFPELSGCSSFDPMEGSYHLDRCLDATSESGTSCESLASSGDEGNEEQRSLHLAKDVSSRVNEDRSETAASMWQTTSQEGPGGSKGKRPSKRKKARKLTPRKRRKTDRSQPSLDRFFIRQTVRKTGAAGEMEEPTERSQEELDMRLARELQRQFDLEARYHFTASRFKGNEDEYHLRKKHT